MRLVAHLREARERLGMTLREMEQATGISRGTLSQIERGERLPKDRIASVLEEHYRLPRGDWYFKGNRFAIVADDEQEPRS